MREVLKCRQVLGPAVSKLAQLMQVDGAGLAGASGKDLLLAAGILGLEHGVGAPDDAHAGAAAGLDAGDRVLKDEALLRGDGLLALGQRLVDGLQGQQEDVGQGLAAAGGDTGVVAEDAAVGGEDGEEVLEVVGLELEVAGVRARGQGHVDGALLGLGGVEGGQELGDAGQRLGRGEVLVLQGGKLADVVLVGNGQLGPVIEELVGGRAGSALELGLDGPGERALAELVEDDVDAEGVEVLSVDEQAIHVEQASPDGWEAGEIELAVQIPCVGAVDEMPGSEDVKNSVDVLSPTKPDSTKDAGLPEEAEPVRFSPEEEASMLQESNSIKTEANSLFSAADYQNALARYHDALSSCPNYLHYPRAVLHSNIAACHLKLEDWDPAIKAASAALDALAKLGEPAKEGEEGKSKEPESVVTAGASAVKVKKEDEDEEVDEEVISSGATRAAPAPLAETKPFQPSDILRIRIKALLRRGRARSSAGGWSNLSGAEQDYQALAVLPRGSLTPADAAVVRAQLRDLPPRTKAAQEAEMSEMWGKLRQLGDGILKPFGLSTQNFQMVKDENTGGYSMNFNNGPVKE
ncbi:Tetratricopeptide repeat protein 1 [Paramyrothecium foliicola]|nr:Tetratricopeptide repeat protein 1 [Paramyrothecium foliicola]